MTTTTKFSQTSTPTADQLIWQTRYQTVIKFIDKLNETTHLLPHISTDKCNGSPARFSWLYGAWHDIKYNISVEELEGVPYYDLTADDVVMFAEVYSHFICDICNLPYRA